MQYYLVIKQQVYDKMPQTIETFITTNPTKYENYKYPEKDGFVISYIVKPIKLKH